MTTPIPASRLLYLDSARGLAALSVTTWHFLMAVYGMNTVDEHFHTPFRLFWYGEADVLFFFIHSGFILSYVFTRRGWSLSIRNYSRFLLERIFRIYPLFLVVLLLSFFILNSTGSYQAAGPYDWISRFWYADTDVNSLLSQAMLIVREPESANLRLIPPDWTLTVELLAGATIPLMVMGGKKHLGIFLLVLALLKLAGIFTTWVLEFGMGVFIFLIWEDLVKVWHKLHVSVKIALAATSITAYSGFFIFPGLFTRDVVIVDPRIDRLIVDGGCMLFFVMLLASAKLQRILSQPVLVKVGKICYSIYLVHQLVLMTGWRIMGDYLKILHERSVWEVAGIYAVFLGIVVLFSLLTYTVVEKPAIRLGKILSGWMSGARLAAAGALK